MVPPRGGVIGPSLVPCPVLVALQLSLEVMYGSGDSGVRLGRLGWGSVMFSGDGDSAEEWVEQFLWDCCVRCVTWYRVRVSKSCREGSEC